MNNEEDPVDGATLPEADKPLKGKRTLRAAAARQAVEDIDGDMPTSLRLPRQLVARIDRQLGHFGDSRADVLRACIGQGIVLLEEQAAVGRAAIAKIAIETANDVSLPQSPIVDFGPVENAIKERRIAHCVRWWHEASALLEKPLHEATDQQVVVFEGEVIRRAVGEIGVIAGRPGWAMAAVRELIGEERYRAIWG